jgi:hypothetical protein
MQNAKLKTRQTKQNKTKPKSKTRREGSGSKSTCERWTDGARAWRCRSAQEHRSHAEASKQTHNQGTTHLTDKHWQIPNCQMQKK